MSYLYWNWLLIGVLFSVHPPYLDYLKHIYHLLMTINAPPWIPFPQTYLYFPYHSLFQFSSTLLISKNGWCRRREGLVILIRICFHYYFKLESSSFRPCFRFLFGSSFITIFFMFWFMWKNICKNASLKINLELFRIFIIIINLWK